MKWKLALVTILASPACAQENSSAGSKNCEDMVIPVHINITTKVIPIPRITDNYLATAYSVNISRPVGWDYATLPDHHVDKVFTISGRYCFPTRGLRKNVLQILTHGAGLDKRYWDWPEDAHLYSYVDAAIERGHSTFAYDRLGAGSSTRADPYLELQGQVEVLVLKALTEHLRALKRPVRVIHVGHSLGSFISNALVNLAPELSDGIVLTGFAHNLRPQDVATTIMVLGLQLASISDPGRFGDLPDGYVTWTGPTALQAAFFEYPRFNPLQLLSLNARRNTIAAGELITLATLSLGSSTFTGFVHVVIPERDMPFCNGGLGCDAASEAAVGRTLFPNARSYETHVEPDMGHLISLHYEARRVYEVILQNMESLGF